LYDTICLGPNIEKHAASPLYSENEIHPHPNYPYKRLKIRHLNKMMQRLKEQIYVEHKSEIEIQQQNWLDF
jgi:hypothetical protein